MIDWQSKDSRFTLHISDAVELLRSLPAESVDLIWADPPYFLSGGGTTNRGGKRTSVDKGKWDAPKTAMEQFAWNMTWMAESRRVLKPTGTIMVCGTLHSVHATGFTMQNLGLRLLNDIAWVKPAPPPNLGCKTLTHSHESILWGSLGPRAKHFFNYKELKAIEGVQMKDVWTFGRPGKDEQAHGKHPTQKPVALVHRCLVAALPSGGTVVDPFMGSGTTGVAATLAGRDWRFVGGDSDKAWIEVTRKRICDELESPDEHDD